MTDSELIARLACPACSFPIGLRRSDSVGDHVHCPVCGASALAQGDARIVIGETCPLTREQAEAIARRLRDRAASLEHLALEGPR